MGYQTKSVQSLIASAVLLPALACSREAPAVFQPRLTEAFASAGVALVWLPELKGATVSGATRWLTDEKALIQVSLRYKCDDQLFFSLFHEAGHVLLHRKSIAFLEGVGDDTPEEREADRFAAEHLIPSAAYHELLAEALSLEQIDAFAGRLGIAAGIVVGRLQHDNRLPFKSREPTQAQAGVGLARRGEPESSGRRRAGRTRVPLELPRRLTAW